MAPDGSPAARRAAHVVASLALLLGTAACTPATPDKSTSSQDGVPARTASPEAATPVEPLVTATPDEHSEVGDLVAGFPDDLLPVPDDAVVLVTSAVPVGDAQVQEVSLNLTTATTVDEVVTLYRSALTAAGFTEVPPAAPATDLAAEVVFVRSGGDELVSIGVLDDGTARTVTVGGRVRTAA